MKAKTNFEKAQAPVQANLNMASKERKASLLGGGLLLAAAFMKQGWLSRTVGVLGSTLLYQGGTGVSPLFKLLGTNHAVNSQTAAVSVPHEQGKHVSDTISVYRPVSDVYAYWRDFRNLPLFMPYLKSVEVIDEKRSHWVVQGPAKMNIEWDAEIIHEEMDTVIAWRSLRNPYMDHAGSARFRPIPGDWGTEIRVEMEYRPMGGAVGIAIANILGLSPEKQLADSLRRFKGLLEIGETPVTDQQL